MTKLKKGDTSPLNVTQEAHHRVFVGLGWDPNTQAGLTDKIGEMMGGKKTYHDLDLVCYVYNKDKNFIAKVGAKSDHSLEEIGQIYHSGDNLEGLGEGDDEQISVELKNLMPEIHSVLFMVSIRSGHHFKDIASPEIRLADGYSDHSFLKYSFDSPERENHSAYVFCSIFREGEQWAMKNISTYLNVTDDRDLEESLKSLL